MRMCQRDRGPELMWLGINNDKLKTSLTTTMPREIAVSFFIVIIQHQPLPIPLVPLPTHKWLIPVPPYCIFCPISLDRRQPCMKLQCRSSLSSSGTTPFPYHAYPPPPSIEPRDCPHCVKHPPHRYCTILSPSHWALEAGIVHAGESLTISIWLCNHHLELDSHLSDAHSRPSSTIH
jgi:hypothetical protein